jgi:hypothetical protein
MPLLTVCNNPVHSDDIGAAADKNLLASPYKVFAGVSCQCEHGVLFLKGRVSSFHHKQVAQEAVARVSGVRQVVNDIEVDGPEWKNHATGRRSEPC